MIKNLLFVGLALITVYGILAILTLWFNIFDAELFIKISVTFGIFGCINLVAIGILYAIKEDEDLKKGNHIG